MITVVLMLCSVNHNSDILQVALLVKDELLFNEIFKFKLFELRKNDVNFCFALGVLVFCNHFLYSTITYLLY